MGRTDRLRASPPMFRSPLLDRFTRVQPWLPPLVFLPAIVVLACLGVDRRGLPEAVVLAVGGWMLWTLMEYWLHRVVFHLEPERGVGARLHWMVHGVHHDHPNDPLRLVMPPAVSVPLGLAVCGGLWAIVGPAAGPALCAGVLAGYLAYDMLHFALHHHRPRTRVGRRLRELHMRHHFEDHERGFGISAPWWDVVFGTRPRRRGGA